MARKIESKRALSVVLISVIALIIVPIIDNLGIGVFNAVVLTISSLGVFLLDSRKGNLNNSFLSALVFLAAALTLDNAYNDAFLTFPLYLQIVGVALVVILFFFTPWVVRYALRHFEHHPIALLVIGRIISVTTAIGTLVFIYLKSGFTLQFGSVTVGITQGWSIWAAFIIFWIAVHLYQIGRNKRDLTANHRFLYNTVALYLLSLIIYIGYIRDSIIFY